MSEQRQPPVFDKMCSTCIFRPGNLMHLGPGALKSVIDANLERGTLLPCHKTTFGQGDYEVPVPCRGFYDKYGPRQSVYQIIHRMGGFEEIPVPED